MDAACYSAVLYKRADVLWMHGHKCVLMFSTGASRVLPADDVFLKELHAGPVDHQELSLIHQGQARGGGRWEGGQFILQFLL